MKIVAKIEINGIILMLGMNQGSNGSQDKQQDL
jgi:hypothetical protein